MTRIVLESVTPKMSAKLLVELPLLLMMTSILSPAQRWKAPSLWVVISVPWVGSDLSVSWNKDELIRDLTIKLWNWPDWLIVFVEPPRRSLLQHCSCRLDPWTRLCKHQLGQSFRQRHPGVTLWSLSCTSPHSWSQCTLTVTNPRAANRERG